MHRRMSYVARLITLCSLLGIACLLAACGTGDASGSNLFPTSAQTSLTPSFSGGVHTYTGMGITIKYPSSWVIGTDETGANGGKVMFRDSLTQSTFSVEILPLPFFTESAPAGAVKNLIPTLQKEGTQTKAVPIAPTATVGGQSWDQAAGTTVLMQGGQPVSIEQVMLATNHPSRPPDARLFLLTYIAPAQAFDQLDASTFQPMLQSFTFTS